MTRRTIEPSLRRKAQRQADIRRWNDAHEVVDFIAAAREGIHAVANEAGKHIEAQNEKWRAAVKEAERILIDIAHEQMVAQWCIGFLCFVAGVIVCAIIRGAA